MNTLRWIRALAFAGGLVLAALPATAQSVTGNWDAPATIHAYSAGYAGFYSDGFVAPSTCTYDTFFISTTNSAGSAILSLLVTAHTAREKIVVIYYHLDANGWCWVDRLDIHRA